MMYDPESPARAGRRMEECSLATVVTGTSELLVARGLQSCGTIRACAVNHCATVITCLHACRLECVVQSAAACNCVIVLLGPEK